MPRQKDLQARRSWLSSRWFYVTIIVVFVLLSASLIKELIRSYQINKEIRELKEQIISLDERRAAGELD